MPKRRIVDSSKLIEAVETGQLDKKIISKFGLKTSRRPRSHSKNDLTKKGKARGGYTRRKKTASEISETIKINKRNSLIVPREIVQGLGYVEGDVFYVRKTKSGIHFKKA
ncbi:MAG: hypothetical protein JRI95_07315 [Deltaproteobacteria bacterium]|nr:hypothetical protein [Deltaproteobacteria bacterium]MBW2086515.1 hypothetical protein [Deltaproteobacteria bacterium]